MFTVTTTIQTYYIFLLLNFVSITRSFKHPLLPPPSPTKPTDRRHALTTILGTITTTFIITPPQPAYSENNDVISATPSYENRNRNRNKNALIREDYFYMTNRIPPRSLNTSPGVLIDDPKFNAWGSCLTDQNTGENSCTYVPLSQRISSYNKYAFNIALGAKDYRALGASLRDIQDASAASITLGNNSLSAIDDSLRKMVLFASGVLTSPNYTGPPMEMLVARYYVNEIDFAMTELRAAVGEGDMSRLLAAWEYGRDSWNSYFTIVNKKIPPKVGDKFDLIS